MPPVIGAAFRFHTSDPCRWPYTPLTSVTSFYVAERSHPGMASTPGRLYAVDTKTGTLAWEFMTDAARGMDGTPRAHQRDLRPDARRGYPGPHRH